MTDRWKPTPPDRLLWAEAYDPETGTWARCRYSNLRKGIIFKSFSPDGGTQVHVLTVEPVDDADTVALASSDPVKNTFEWVQDGLPLERVNEGYHVIVHHVGTFAEIQRKAREELS